MALAKPLNGHNDDCKAMRKDVDTKVTDSIKAGDHEAVGIADDGLLLVVVKSIAYAAVDLNGLLILEFEFELPAGRTEGKVIKIITLFDLEVIRLLVEGKSNDGAAADDIRLIMDD